MARWRPMVVPILIATVLASVFLGNRESGHVYSPEPQQPPRQPIGACSCCEKPFYHRETRHKCSVCSKDMCPTCARVAPRTPQLSWTELEGYLCLGCWPEGERIQKRYETALIEADGIETWSKNYKGRLPIDPSGPTTEVQSLWEYDKDACERQLRIAAAFKKFSVVVKLEFERASREEVAKAYYGRRPDSMRTRPIWRATGKAAHRR